jgi:hypothetical protein
LKYYVNYCIYIIIANTVKYSGKKI